MIVLVTSFHASSQLADDAPARPRKDTPHRTHMRITHVDQAESAPKAQRWVRSGAAVRLAAYLVAFLPYVPSRTVCPYVCLTDFSSTNFLTLFFLLLTLCFLVLVRPFRLSVPLCRCPPWPLVQTAMICQSPCGSPICNSCFSYVFIGFLMSPPPRSHLHFFATLCQQKVRKILFFYGKLVEINFLWNLIKNK